ncbi:eukaryotic translation initiation factor 3 subunit B-like isoform X1 [Hylobates moloch]|uniref:eukaryotic translation initiation factor 3 subunit B-like isoform X1 n=1 Tax=Hylobates moloch TaxID=81572 RepID=UPI002675CF37|nr:eukaryotic translation initiation factor 3 subunit B-like isoform X1 [Hylobates moloch]
MQDAENVAVPEAAEERAEPGQQQPAAEPPPAEGLLRPAGPGAPEAAGTEASSEKVGVAEAGPEPEGEAPGEHARDERSDSRAQAASEDAGGNEGRAAEAEPRALENGDADEPSFSDPEDFVDDVSEEGEGARGGAGERRGSVARVPEVGDVVGLCHRFVQKFH